MTMTWRPITLEQPRSTRCEAAEVRRRRIGSSQQKSGLDPSRPFATVTLATPFGIASGARVREKRSRLRTSSTANLAFARASASAALCHCTLLVQPSTKITSTEARQGQYSYECCSDMDQSQGEKSGDGPGIVKTIALGRIPTETVCSRSPKWSFDPAN